MAKRTVFLHVGPAVAGPGALHDGVARRPVARRRGRRAPRGRPGPAGPRRPRDPPPAHRRRPPPQGRGGLLGEGLPRGLQGEGGRAGEPAGPRGRHPRAGGAGGRRAHGDAGARRRHARRRTRGRRAGRPRRPLGDVRPQELARPRAAGDRRRHRRGARRAAGAPRPARARGRDRAPAGSSWPQSSAGQRRRSPQCGCQASSSAVSDATSGGRVPSARSWIDTRSKTPRSELRAAIQTCCRTWADSP